MSLLNGVEVALLRIPCHYASDRLNRNHAPNRALKHHLGHGPICPMLRLAGCQSRYARCQFLQQATTRKGSSDASKKQISELGRVVILGAFALAVLSSVSAFGTVIPVAGDPSWEGRGRRTLNPSRMNA